MKVIIIGGVAGGATAAARFAGWTRRRRLSSWSVRGFVSYANCGLPYYIGGVIADPEELTLQTPQEFLEPLPGGRAGAPRGHRH